MATERFALQIGDSITEESILQQLREDVTKMCNLNQDRMFPGFGHLKQLRV